MTQASRRKLDLSQINVVRAVAMAWIFFHHLWHGMRPYEGFTGIIGQAWDRLLVSGALGVTIFNIVTGFVLSLPYLGPGGDAPSPGFREFLSRRFLRICPNYYIAMLFFTLVTALVLGVPDVGRLLLSTVERLFFLQSLDTYNLQTSMAAYWWLGLLAQFYLAFPFLLRFYRRVGPGRAFAFIAVGSWALYKLVFLVGPSVGFSGWYLVGYSMSLLGMFPEFALGMWMAWCFRRGDAAEGSPARPFLPFARPFRWFTAAMALLYVLGMGTELIQGVPEKYYVGAAGCLLFLVAVMSLPGMDRLGRNRTVAWVAAASYSIYLTHQPILALLSPISRDWGSLFAHFLFQTLVCGFWSLLAASALDRIVAWWGERRKG